MPVNHNDSTFILKRNLSQLKSGDFSLLETFCENKGLVQNFAKVCNLSEIPLNVITFILLSNRLAIIPVIKHCGKPTLQDTFEVGRIIYNR